MRATVCYWKLIENETFCCCRFQLFCYMNPKYVCVFFLDFIYHLLASNTSLKIVYSFQEWELWECQNPKFSITDQCFELQIELPEQVMSHFFSLPFWCRGGGAAHAFLQPHVCCWKFVLCSAQGVPQALSLCSGTCTSEVVDLGLSLLQWRKDGMVKLLGGLRRCMLFRSLH